MLNLGNPEARKWVTEHFSRLIKEQGVDLYREDFNIDPLGYWRGNDAPDRQGITENLYIQGNLAYWDELRRRFPDNLIDSCASGGRRNDLETLRRAVPLLRSDFYSASQPGNPAAITGSQGQTYGLSFWVPYYGIGVFCDDVYDVRSHITPELGMASLAFSTNKGPIMSVAPTANGRLACGGPGVLRRLLSADEIQLSRKTSGWRGNSIARNRHAAWCRHSVVPRALTSRSA